MKSVSGKLGVVLIGLVIFGCAEVWGVDWELIEKIEDNEFYYDKKDVTHSPQKIVKVWVRQVYTKKDKGMFDMIGLRYENLSYSINSLEFVCGTGLTRFLTKTYFSENGDLLGLEDPPDIWESISPNSMFDALYKMVCK